MVSDCIVRAAEPPLIATVPSVVVPSLNVTAPLTPGLSVTVSVTASPKSEGLALTPNTMGARALFTGCISVVEVLAAYMESPL